MRPAQMNVSATTLFLWVTSDLLTGMLCILVARRSLFSRLPLFSAYITVIFVREVILCGVYVGGHYTSRLAFYSFWVSQGIILVARGLAIAEVAWRSLHEYRGIWLAGRMLLMFTAIVLVLIAAWDARGNAPWIAPFILTGERGLEVATALVLLALLFLCGYYRVGLDAVHRSIAVGLCFYSAIQVLNNTFMQRWLKGYFESWNHVRAAAFLFTQVIWLWALYKPLTAARPAPVMLSQHVYDLLSPQVNYRLRALNQKLLEMFEA